MMNKMMKNIILTCFLVTCLAVQSKAEYSCSYATPLGVQNWGVDGAQYALCCPEGTRRAENLNRVLDVSEVESPKFDDACPCISEEIEHGEDGWQFLEYLGNPKYDVSCEEAEVLKAKIKKEERNAQLDQMNAAFCQPGPAQCPPNPYAHCTATQLQCVDDLKQLVECPIEEIEQIKVLELIMKSGRVPSCVRAREEAELKREEAEKETDVYRRYRRRLRRRQFAGEEARRRLLNHFLSF